MAFTFNLETTDGRPADPPTLKAITPTFKHGDLLALGPDRAVRVVLVRLTAVDKPPVLIVQDTSE
jgi:hypothetical protein